jgi:menaquinone-dependent protoporphyrinogen IX oxidase
MRRIVVYKSKTGFTEKYAQWIAEMLKADLYPTSAVTIDKLDDYDVIVYGGGIYASGINGVGLITKNALRLHDKKLVVFATGVSPGRKDVIEDVRDKNLPGELQKQIKFFYLRGGFNYELLRRGDKFLMTLLKWMLKTKKFLGRKLTADERGMLEAYNTPLDFTRRKNIRALVHYVKADDMTAV